MNNKIYNIEHIEFYLLDLMCLLFSFLCSYYIRYRNIFLTKDYIVLLIVITLFQSIECILLQPYKNILNRGLLIELKETIKYCIVLLVCIIMFLFITKQSINYSRIVIGVFFILYLSITYLLRIIKKNNIIKSVKNINSKYIENVLIIANEDTIKKSLDIIKQNIFYNIVGVCLFKNRKNKKSIYGYNIVSNEKNIINYISHNHIDTIYIGLDINSLDNSVLEELYVSGIKTFIAIPQYYDKFDEIEYLNDVFVLSMGANKHSYMQIAAKRIIDIIGGLVGLLFACLFTVTIGPIIYCKSPGNIFYSSKRVGLNGKIFNMYKFRSMVTNADELKESLAKNNKIQDGMMFKIENDPRIIPGIGNFIRKTSIDEFPQFFNVLKGDMSLVGTRPPTIDEWEKYKPEHRARLSIKPGITGLWQTSGRSNITNFDEVVKLDVKYIKNWTISMDIKIIVKTVFLMFDKNKGAY